MHLLPHCLEDHIIIKHHKAYALLKVVLLPWWYWHWSVILSKIRRWDYLQRAIIWHVLLTQAIIIWFTYLHYLSIIQFMSNTYSPINTIFNHIYLLSLLSKYQTMAPILLCAMLTKSSKKYSRCRRNLTLKIWVFERHFSTISKVL